MKLLAATIAVPIALLGWQWWGDRSLEHMLAPIASGVAGRQVGIDCQGFLAGLVDVQGREGEVRFDASGVPEPKVFLTRRTCGRLEDFTETTHHAELDCLGAVDWSSHDPLPFASECYANAADTVYAILILAHEAYHTAGVANEATTNCYALQAMAWTATQLGAEQREGELLAQAMEALEPGQGSDYGTGECHAGMSLDLHPETPTFPTESPLAPPHGLGGRRGLAADAV